MATVLPSDKLGTGDAASVVLRRFSFVVPVDTWLIEAVLGMLSAYTEAAMWYQVGTATPEQAAEYISAIFNSIGTDMAITGVIVPYGGGVLPLDWLACDGASYLRSDYPALFAAIGTTWGAADSSHFNVPDLRGRALVGQGLAGSGTTFNLGSTGGEETHTLTVPEIPAHDHSYGGTLLTSTVVPPPLDGLSPNPFPATTSSTGGGGAHNNLQPYGVVNYAIIT